MVASGGWENVDAWDNPPHSKMGMLAYPCQYCVAKSCKEESRCTKDGAGRSSIRMSDVGEPLSNPIILSNAKSEP